MSRTLRVAWIGVAVGTAVIAVTLAVPPALSPGPPEQAALARARAERPGVTWHVRAAHLNPLPYQVHDSKGQLRETDPGRSCPLVGQLLPVLCPPPPKWTVELEGRDSSAGYDALIDVAPLTHQVGGFQILSQPRIT